MKVDKSSKTAQYMALFRALETARPGDDRIFTDPFAINFLDSDLKFITKLSSLSPLRKFIGRYIHNKIPGALTSGIGRTKYIDDILHKAIQQGVKQVIILGAGFDTRGLRLDFMKSIPVIEIDHPNTSKHKLDILKKEFNPLPANTTYLKIDFNTQGLDELSREHAINFSIPTAIIWEGVTNYLSAEAVAATFSWISKFTKGSYAIFTYVHKDILVKPDTFFGGEKLLGDLDKIEERWTFGFNPPELPEYLKRFDLELVEDLGAEEYRKRYLPTRSERGYEFYRTAYARKVM